MAYEVASIFTLKDNFTGALKNIIGQQGKFKRETEQARQQLEVLYAKKRQLKLDNNAANKAIKQTMKHAGELTDEMKNHLDKTLNKKRELKIQTKQIDEQIKKTIKKLDPLEEKLNKINKKKVRPSIEPEGRSFFGMGKGGFGLGMSVPGVGLAATAGLVAGAGAGLFGMLKQGTTLEQQQISMEHFIGVNNKGKSQSQIKAMSQQYLGDLRQNANITPFETAEVVSAGARAINVAGGNTKQAMDILKLAENMAALNPGKSLSDAIEALADLKTGETERMKEFGFKITQDDIKKSGGKVANLKNAEGISIKDMFAGGSEKLSTSGTGLVSTITGSLGSAAQDAGLKMLEAMKPTLEKIVPLIDLIGPKLAGIGDAMGKGMGVAMQHAEMLLGWVVSNQPTITGFADNIKSVVMSVINFIQPLIPPLLVLLGSIIGWAVSNMPKLQSAIGSVFQFLQPVIADVIKVVQGLWDRWAKAWPTISDIISTAWKVIQPIMKGIWNLMMIVWDVEQVAWPAIQAIIDGVWKAIKPIIEALGWVTNLVGGGIGWIRKKVEGQAAAEEGKQHAFGLKRVPYDNYPAILHEGETVLTKQESNGLNGFGNININMNGITIREEADIDKIARALARELKGASQNFAGT